MNRIWSARTSARDETRLITKQEIGDCRTGIVVTDNVVIAGDKTARRRSVLVIAFCAAVATAVEIRVAAITQVGSDFEYLTAANDCDGIGKVVVIGLEEKRAAVADEFLIRVRLDDSEQNDALIGIRVIDVCSTEISGDIRIKTERTVNARIVNSDSNTCPAGAGVIDNCRRKRMRIA